jgi:hypothetical protein
MDSPLLIAAGVSFIAGLLGYIIARMWIKPIVRYHITKRKLDHELTQYLAQINEAVGPDEKREKQKRGDAMLKTARKHAMGLVACYDADIPYWYRLLLDSRQESPTVASGLLTNLSKIRDGEQVKDRIERARKTIGLK